MSALNPRSPRPASRPSRHRRVVSALAATVMGASLAGAAVLGSTGAEAAPVTAAMSAASIKALPATCNASVTVIRPDRSIAVGAVSGAKAQLFDTGVKLAYAPKAQAYLGTSSSKGLTIDRYFVTDGAGRLHVVSLFDRPGQTPAITMTDKVVGAGWGGIRTMVSSGPYLYGVTSKGALNRYLVTKDYGTRSAGVLASRGWSGIRSLGFAGWWSLPKGRVAEDIVGLANDGTVRSYMVPRTAPLTITSTVLAKGWGMFSHVAVGECEGSKARPVIGVKPGGDVHAYYDANGNDMSWRDLRTGPRIARGWTGLVAD